jgi:hypothetical protein
VIEICKASANGMSSRAFSYSISGGSSITVLGGRCSGAITVAGSTVTVTEGPSNPVTDIASILVRPSIRRQSADLLGRSVTVVPGASTSSETLVTFVNEPAGGARAPVKICPASASPSLIGRELSFTVNDGPALSVAASYLYADLSTWSCRLAGDFPVGSHVTARALIPPGTLVNWIDTVSDPDALLGWDGASGTATVAVSPGGNILVYDVEAAPVSGGGYLEVCKDRAFVGGGSDVGVQGLFAFTVTDAAGATYPVSVLAGQCSEPLAVAAGLVQVQEQPAAGVSLSGVFAIPGERLLATNLVNRIASVEVPVSADPTDETQVHFVNQAQRGQLKVCKALGPSSAFLAGQTFWFDWRSSTGSTGTIPITAASSTQCRILGDFPIGTELTITERNPGAFVDSKSVGSVRVGSGVSTITVTNTASGVLEICKARVPDVATQPTFRFRVDASPTTVSVQAGKCSFPLPVAVGSHAVTELADDTYELDTSRADGGIAVYPRERELSRSPSTRTVTVAVPYGPEGETLVTFTNRIKQAFLKVCKTILPTSQDALGGKTFEFLVDISGFTVQNAYLRPGECTLPFGPFPIPDNDTGVFVNETTSPLFVVDGISLSGGGRITLQTATSAFIRPAPGINVLTFRNKAR